jgi:acetylornithine deacetylase/succinyl-diaminopimelate desuccinylase-like protein
VLEKLTDWVDAHRDEALALWADWIRQPSVSSDGTGFPDATQHAARLIESCGLTAEIADGPGLPVVFGTAEGPPGAPHVLIYGHYDVQPPGPLAEWTTPPFEPDLREGRMYGRGTGDNKGQHLAQLLGLRALREVSGSLPCRVTVLLDGEEEIGSPNLPAAVQQRFADEKPDLALWSDGPVHESGRSTVVLGVRGVVAFQLRVTGANAALHSGNWGGVAPNPAWRLVQLLATMRDAGGTTLIEGVDTADPLTAAELEALQALPVDIPAALAGIGVDAMEPPAERAYFERLTRPTFTINSLTCEDAGEHRTVIPNVAVAKCDMRLVGGQRVEKVKDAILRHVRKHDPSVEVTFGAAMEPSRTLPETPYTAAVLRGWTAGQGEEPLLMPALGGSLPIAGFGEVLGIPCYGVPLANVDERNHAPDENMELDRFMRGISACAAVQLALGGAL